MTLFDTLAIDWGSVRIGMAFGHSTTGLVVPFSEHLHWSNFWDILKNQIEKRQITQIVVGRPTNFALGMTETSFKIDNFIQELQAKLNLWQATDSTDNQKFQTEKAKTDSFWQDKSINSKSVTDQVLTIETTDNLTNTSTNFANSSSQARSSPFSNLKISVINERHSTQKSQTVQWEQSKTSKKDFQNQHKKQNKFQQTFGPSKNSLNHLAAAEILTSFFEQNPQR